MKMLRHVASISYCSLLCSKMSQLFANVTISWVVPLPSNSDHQDYYMFSRESLYINLHFFHCYREGAISKPYQNFHPQKQHKNPPVVVAFFSDVGPILEIRFPLSPPHPRQKKPTNSKNGHQQIWHKKIKKHHFKRTTQKMTQQTQEPMFLRAAGVLGSDFSASDLGEDVFFFCRFLAAK